MKKLLSVVLVLVIAMSVAVTASATDMGTAVAAAEGGITLPSMNDVFVAVSDFMKLESIMVFVNAFHEAMGGFYQQLDVWLKAFGVVAHGVLGSVFG